MSFYMKQRYPIKNQSNKQKTTDITRKLQINIPHEHDTKQFSLNQQMEWAGKILLDETKYQC